MKQQRASASIASAKNGDHPHYCAQKKQRSSLPAPGEYRPRARRRHGGSGKDLRHCKRKTWHDTTISIGRTIETGAMISCRPSGGQWGKRGKARKTQGVTGNSHTEARRSRRILSPSPRGRSLIAECESRNRPYFLLFNRDAGFLPPQPHFAMVDARRACQGWPLFAATEGLAFT